MINKDFVHRKTFVITKKEVRPPADPEFPD